MKTVDLNDIHLQEVWSMSDPVMRAKVHFPFSAGVGADHVTLAYFELEPGHFLGTHRDSAEEIMLVLSGAVEVTVGNECAQLSAGQAVLIPTRMPHRIRNLDGERARCVGFFADGAVECRFGEPIMPSGYRVVGSPVRDAIAVLGRIVSPAEIETVEILGPRD